MERSEYGDPQATNILIQPVDSHQLNLLEKEAELVREHTDRPFRLIAFCVEDWNRDLSPWEAPAVFGKEGFGGKGNDTLAEILTACKDLSGSLYLGGYSLAGLFALWAAGQTDRFHAVAAASPSVWYPGFDTYLREHPMQTDRIYLSLGDKEEKTRNQVMATVGDRIRWTGEYLDQQGRTCILEWNEGNHFRDFELRMAKGFAWVLNG